MTCSALHSASDWRKPARSSPCSARRCARPARRAVAIVHELVPAGITALHGVLPEGRDEIAGMGEVDAGGDEARPQPGGLVGGRIGALAIERPLHGVEPCQLLLGRRPRIVGDVVDGPGEGIIGRDMRRATGAAAGTSRPGSSRRLSPCRRASRYRAGLQRSWQAAELDEGAGHRAAGISEVIDDVEMVDAGDLGIARRRPAAGPDGRQQSGSGAGTRATPRRRRR